MTWQNRYIGDPLLTGVLNLLYCAGVDDAHCGRGAMTRSCYERARLRGPGMEFASEVVIKATLLCENVVQHREPVSLARDSSAIC